MRTRVTVPRVCRTRNPSVDLQTTKSDRKVRLRRPMRRPCAICDDSSTAIDFEPTLRQA